MEKSINRAITLLGSPADYDNYESIKIKPVKGGCCCFHCWPHTWDSVNGYISPFGPLQDEGDVLVGDKDKRFVLECHESGPEIVYYVGLGTASILLIKSVIELIMALLKALEKEKGKGVGNLKIVRRRMIKGSINEEQVMEINLPLSKDVAEKLESNLKKALVRKKDKRVYKKGF